ncbi:MAG: hypothetical protein WEE67_10285 [Chloroflexota bacterium]
MGATLDETRVELAAQRARVRATADRLEAAARRGFDLRARLRRHPVQTAGVAVGLAFILLGGPRRTVRQIRRALGGSAEAERAYASLPGSLRALVDASASGGKDRDQARRQLALAIHAWREDPKNRKRAARLVSETLSPPGPGRAFWSFVEIAAATAAGIVARRVVTRRLAEEPKSRPPAAGPRSEVTPPADRYSGWSGQQGTPAGPARPTLQPATPAEGSARPARKPS